MATRLVTLGTDGFSTWVQTPDGQKLNLGTLSALKFVSVTAPSGASRPILDAFLKDGQVMYRADMDKAQELFVPRRGNPVPLRSRWSADSFIPPVDRTQLPLREQPMSTEKSAALFEHVRRIEARIQAFESGACPGRMLKPSAIKNFRQMVACLCSGVECDSGCVSCDTAGQGCTSCPMQAAQPQQPVAVDPQEPMAADPTVQALEENSAIVEDALTKIDATNQTIDKLAAQGRKFNASKAKSDLYGLAARMRDILGNADLAHPMVRKDLNEIAASVDTIHGLFAGAQ